MSKKEKLKLRLVQMNSVDKAENNILAVDKQLSELDKKNSSGQLIVLPENALFFRIRQDAKKLLAHDLSEDFWGRWTTWCKKNQSAILVGGTPILHEGEVCNASVWVDEKGPKVAYKKIHLFDVEVAGHKPVRESDQFKAGHETSVVDWLGWKIGLSICYDLRFPELYLAYANVPVDLIMVPSSFLVPTGLVHWHVLLRARAIENQCFVMAPAQSGRHVSVLSNPGDEAQERSTFGHSLAIGPWGQVLGEISQDGPGHLDLELDPAEISKVRGQIPMVNHRKLSYNRKS